MSSDLLARSRGGYVFVIPILCLFYPIIFCKMFGNLSSPLSCVVLFLLVVVVTVTVVTMTVHSGPKCCFSSHFGISRLKIVLG